MAKTELEILFRFLSLAPEWREYLQINLVSPKKLTDQLDLFFTGMSCKIFEDGLPKKVFNIISCGGITFDVTVLSASHYVLERIKILKEN